MSKRQTLMLFGVIIISFLFLGFPASWDKIIASACGVIIIFIAFKLKPELVKAKKYSFVEHKNFSSQSEVVEPLTKPATPVSTEAASALIINPEMNKIS